MRDDAISVSLGLEGFTVLDTVEADDQVEVLIEPKVGAGVCPGCGGVSTCVHDRRRENPRHRRPRQTHVPSLAQAAAPMRAV